MSGASGSAHGLSGPLPAGETLLWQGAPDLGAMVLRVFHVRKVAIYFALLALWRLYDVLAGGAGLSAASRAMLPLLGLGAAAAVILGGIAALVCRTTVYSITSRRVLMRIGVALPITFNLPFKVLASAALRLHAGGVGDVPLALADGNRLAYLILWPHARPWRLARAEPTLRCVPEAAKVARLLAEAVATALPEATEVSGTLHEPAAAKRGTRWPLAPAAA